MGTYVRMKTELPGPEARRWLDRRDRVIPQGITSQVPTVIARAQGAVVVDVDGNEMLDLTSGIGVLNVGHTNERVVRAIHEQSRRYLHTDFAVLPYPPLIELAERLCRLAPGEGPKKAFFFNSGAEAVENAVKIARLATGRSAVFAFEGAFHGRTLMALTLTGRAAPYRQGMGPLAPEVYRLPFPDPYRKPRGLSEADWGDMAVESLLRAFRTQVAPEEVAAIVLEPILGEGGVVLPPAGFWERIQELCRRHGILLIVDEIQTGFGRTGRWFACEHFGLDPDLMCVAKAIAGGLPLSGVVGKSEWMDRAPEGSVGGTFVGNPVACAAALAVLDEIEAHGLLELAERVGSRFRARLRELAGDFPHVGDIRGLGAMTGVEIVRDLDSRAPAPERAQRVLTEAASRGLLLLRSGVYGNVIRVLAPLVLTEDQADEAASILGHALHVREA